MIDLSEFRLAYRNLNVRLVYLHLCLISGYHDDDRDLVDISLRNLASEVGITLSATRHALRILSDLRLISVEGSLLRVTKWIPEKTIGKRQAKKESVQDEGRRQEKSRQEEIDRRYQSEKARIKSIEEETGKTQFMIFYENLQKRAQEGDQDAIQSLKRHRSMYEQQKAYMENKMKNKKA